MTRPFSINFQVLIYFYCLLPWYYASSIKCDA